MAQADQFPHLSSLDDTLQKLQPHDHLCLIYESEEEWGAVIALYLALGLRRGEKCVYIRDAHTPEEIRAILAREGVDVAAAESSGQFSILDHTEAYTQGGIFDPDRMLALLVAETKKAIAEGYPALRATGEFSWMTREYPGSERVIEYEARLNSEVFSDHPCIGICQYDRTRFTPEIIQGIVMTHPLLVHGARVYRNSYYMPPEEFLSERRTENQVEDWLTNVEREHRTQEHVQFLAGVLERSSQPFVVVNRDDHIVTCNDAFSSLIGYSLKQLLDMRLTRDLIPQKWYDILSHTQEELQRSREPQRCELELMHSKGTSVPVAAEMHGVYSAALDPQYYYAFFTDITERKRAEEALRVSREEVQALNEELQSTAEELRITNETLEERVQQRTENLASSVEQLQRHKTMVDLANEGIIVFDLDDRITYWNRGAERLYGWDADEARGNNIHSLLQTEFSSLLEEIKHVLFEKGAWHGELAHITAHGDRIVVDSYQTLQRDVAGNPTAVFEINTNITKRKRAEEQLQATSAYARSLIEASLDPLVTISADGIITDVNKATEEVTGCSRDELIGSDFSDYFTEPDKANAGYKQVFTDGFVRDYPLALRHTSGRITEVLYNATLFRNEAGEVQGVFAAARDITERKRAEEQVRTTSLYARNLIEASLDPLVTISAEGKITDVNKATEEVTGYLRHELIGSDFSDYFTEPAEARKGYEQVFANGFVKDYPLRIRHKSCILTDVLYNATVYRNEAGEIQGVFAAARDVTERKRAEGLLRAASLYARSLIEASLDPLVTISAEGKITDVNKATEEVTGYLRHELIGSDFCNYFTEPEKARAGYKQVFTDAFVRDYPLAIRHKSGRVTDVLYNATIYRDEAGEVQGVFAAARDVTERKRAESELQRYSSHLESIVEERTAQLKDSERLAGIGQTAAMIGHDLRNPLQGLQYIVDLQMLRFERMHWNQRDAGEWKQHARLLDRIAEQITYMNKIVDDLQDYARPIKPEYERVPVSAVINDVLQSLPDMDSVEIITDLSDLHMVADVHLMRRAIANLLLNAIQAMPEGGRVTLTAAATDGSVAVSVHDTGVGIPEEMKDKLFSPLITGKAKGTGLGLAVVKRIVDAHGGTIEFESAKGQGTTFTMTLPRNA